MSKQTEFVLAVFFMITAFIACSESDMDNKTQYSNLKDVPVSSWEKLAEKKIFFGHQSVGQDIIDGINDIMRDYPPIRIHIVDLDASKEIEKGSFFHSPIGKNMKPISKIQDFKQILDKGAGHQVDAAFLKLCYIDFQSGTDYQKIFSEYSNTISELEKRYPKVKFIHLTVPLTSKQAGIKYWIKRILGKPIRGYEDNVVKNGYNRLVLDKYGDKALIFGLAKAESTYPDGTRETFEKDGKTFYALVPDYTDDGSHLNIFGRKIIAEQFLLFLVNAL